jgi:hypothetical protein
MRASASVAAIVCGSQQKHKGVPYRPLVHIQHHAAECAAAIRLDMYRGFYLFALGGPEIEFCVSAHMSFNCSNLPQN